MTVIEPSCRREITTPTLPARVAATGLVALLLLAAPTWAGPAAATARPVDLPCPARVPRIVLWQSGDITLDGRKVQPKDIGPALVEHDPIPAEVCFAQDGPGEPAGEQAADLGNALESLTRLRIRLSIYTGSDFKWRIGSYGGTAAVD
ncbi:MAG: hypothetical protein KGN16_09195 [Burkholderiales bacterium]|nr:hypothetical protein [Burkholderiales bacterium]